MFGFPMPVLPSCHLATLTNVFALLCKKKKKLIKKDMPLKKNLKKEAAVNKFFPTNLLSLCVCMCILVL